MAIGIGIGIPFLHSSKLEVPKNVYTAIISTSTLNLYYNSLYAVEVWISTDNENFTKLGNSVASPYQVIDTLLVAKKHFGFSSNKLDALAGYFGIQTKLDTDFSLWANCMNGSQEALDYMMKYNILDTEILEEVFLNLRPWIKSIPNMSLYYDDNKQRCCSCGGEHLHEVEDKLYYTSVGAYQVYRCMDCGGLSRGRKTVIEKSKNKTTLTSVGK